MKAEILIPMVIDPALSLLPTKMDSYEARRMLLAIGYQESKFRHRYQVPRRHATHEKGPARGYWQCERMGAVWHVITHQSTKQLFAEICNELDYPAYQGDVIYEAIEHNDVLAAVLARLNLWSWPHALPANRETAWEQYLDVWRPGHERPEDWPVSWAYAEEVLT